VTPTLERVEAREEVGEAVLRPSRFPGAGLIWLVPLLAVAIAAWLVYTSIRDRGPIVEVSFESAEGLEPGKTKVKYKDVEMATVGSVELSSDAGRIVVTLQMKAGTERFLDEDTRFWIVRPRIGVGGVSGLGTVITGAFVELDPGSGGSPRREFVGLEEPPLIRSTVPGTGFELDAERLGGLSRGAPIYYRGIPVGQVLGYRLDPERRHVTIPIFVQAPHDRLVTRRTRFWDAGGVALRTDGGGFELQLASLQALLLGGVEFDGAEAGDGEPPAPPGTRFPLHADRAAAMAASLTRKIPVLVEFAGQTRGLRPGSAVETRGIRIGTVSDVTLAWQEAVNGLVVQARLELEPERVSPIGAASGEPSRQVSLEELIESGLRAQLKTASLLTGELYVDLDFRAEAEPGAMRTVRGLPVIPAVPTELETLSASLGGILEKLAALPLEPLVEELRRTARAAGDLAQGEKLGRALDGLLATLDSLRRTASVAEEQTPALLRSLRQAAEQARDGAAALESLFGGDSRTRADLVALLREAAAAARALRNFAELLQRNPEALLRGRAEAPR
jgi:paraquat-inducible protein B